MREQGGQGGQGTTTQNAKFGQNTKSLLKQVKKLILAGEAIKVSNIHELDIDLLTEIKRRKAELDVIENEKARKKKLQQVEIIDKYIKLVCKKADETKWTGSEFRVAVKLLKNDFDGAMATKKNDPVNMYHKMKERHSYVMEEH